VTASDLDDTIFVFTGAPAAPADTNQNLGITLQSGQKLIGQRVGLRFNGVPIVDPRPNAPVISNAGLAPAPGNIPVVMLATGNEVAGFTINADFNEAVLTLGGANHNIHDNNITFGANGREGIRLLNVTGNNLVTTNTITGSLRDGIKLANNENQAGDPDGPTPIVATVTIDRNTITGSAQDGINVNFDGVGANVTLNILTNSIDNSDAAGANEGININSLGAASITADISRNTIANSGGEAIDLSAEGTSTFSAFVANNDLSISGVANDFRAAIAAAGASFCLELVNNFNAALDSTFLVNNAGAQADFQFFELGNDNTAVRQALVTDVPQGTCAITINGAASFEANCAKCHTGNGLGLNTRKELIATDVTNATAAEINLQLDTNGSMILEFSPAGRLRLTQQEIDAIVSALAAP
jgi:mono/diheme cytochrome c family protein